MFCYLSSSSISSYAGRAICITNCRLTSWFLDPTHAELLATLNPAQVRFVFVVDESPWHDTIAYLGAGRGCAGVSTPLLSALCCGDRLWHGCG